MRSGLRPGWMAEILGPQISDALIKEAHQVGATGKAENKLPPDGAREERIAETSPPPVAPPPSLRWHHYKKEKKRCRP